MLQTITPAADKTLARIRVLARQSRPKFDHDPDVFHQGSRRYRWEIDTSTDNGGVYGEIFVECKEPGGRLCWAWCDTFGIEPDGSVWQGPELFRRGAGQYSGRDRA